VQHGAVAGAAPAGWVGRVQNGLHFVGRQMPDQTRLGLAGIARIRRICSIAEGTRYSTKFMK
jgi:hypothetical protein